MQILTYLLIVLPVSIVGILLVGYLKALERRRQKEQAKLTPIPVRKDR